MTDSTHGGARPGSGRKKLSEEEKRSNVTIKLLPGADAELNLLAEKAACSKGGVLEWFALSPDSAEARKECIARAALFTRRQPMKEESAAAGHSRAALRRELKRRVTQAGARALSKQQAKPSQQ